MELKNLAAKLGVLVTRYVADLRGVSTVEYALIVVAIIGIVGVGAGILGGAFDSLFTDLSTRMTGGAAAVAATAT